MTAAISVLSPHLRSFLQKILYHGVLGLYEKETALSWKQPKNTQRITVPSLQMFLLSTSLLHQQLKDAGTEAHKQLISPAIWWSTSPRSHAQAILLHNISFWRSSLSISSMVQFQGTKKWTLPQLSAGKLTPWLSHNYRHRWLASKLVRVIGLSIWQGDRFVHLLFKARLRDKSSVHMAVHFSYQNSCGPLVWDF